MSKLFLFLWLCVVSAVAGAEQYSFVSNQYSIIRNYTPPCSAPTCANYLATMRVGGAFSTSGPLSANLTSQNISGLLTSWSFSDGINTISNTNPLAQIFDFSVTTDSSGAIIQSNIQLQKWQQTPQVGGYFNLIEIQGNNQSAAFTAVQCDSLVGSICRGWSYPSSSSLGASRQSGIWIVNTATFGISSSAFDNMGVIPNQFTYSGFGQCAGNNWSPPLSFSNIPVGAQALAVVMQDLTVPWIHWVAYNVPAGTTTLPYNASASATFPQELNDFGTQGYGGPCPPAGGGHIYAYTVYALNSTFGSPPTLAQISGASIGQATLLGTRSSVDNVPWNPPSPPGPSPAPIPTLSEWAQFIMMLLIIGTVGWYGRRTMR